MKVLLQLVSHADVIIESQSVGSISYGMLAFVGIEKADTMVSSEKMIDRLIRYRIFPDENGKTNLDLRAATGSLLLVPQFTLVADTNQGTRPGFSNGMPPTEGKHLFSHMVHYAKSNYAKVESGRYGAHMLVQLCNDGPMTFLLES